MAAKPKVETLYRDGGIDRIRRIFPDDANATVERPLFDSIAQEPARLAGTKARLYSLRRAKNHHPLYREPGAGSRDWEFQGPWEVWAGIEFDQSNDIDAETSSEGLKRNATATLWVARKEFEDAGAPEPKIGDVVEFWDLKAFAGVTSFQFWDVVLANPDGNIMSTEIFVQWKITLKVRGQFDPVRKIENAKV